MNLPPPVRRTLAPKWLAAAAAIAVTAVLAACAARGAAPIAKRGVAEAPAPLAPGARGYPFAASRVRTEDYFGIPASDDFAWLENAADPATRAWVAAETAYGRRYLDAMPVRAALRQRLQSLMASTANAYSALAERGGLVFALKDAPPGQPAVLVALRSVDDVGSERVVFDPDEAAPEGAPTIEFFRPSPDGRKVALALSSGGDGVALRVVDVDTGRLLPDEIPHAVSAAAGGDLAWGVGSAGFFCVRHAAAGGAGAVQVVFHKLGTASSQDRVELADGLPRRARIRLESTRDARNVLALVENPDGGDVSLYLKSADANGEGVWRRLASGSDGVRDAQFGDDDAIWLRSIADAPRGKVLRLPLAAAARTISWDKVAMVAVPQEGDVQRFAVAGGRLYLAEGRGGTSRLRSIDLRTRRVSVVALPATSGVAALVRVGRGDVVAQVASVLEPPAWMRVGRGRARRTALAMSSDAGFGDSELVRESATSRDGTPVAVDILRRKGTRLDGHNPVLLTVAGATPDFDAARRVWLDRGGVIALATVRDGLRSRRQDTFDDFIAAAGRLVERGYTQPSLLGIRGRGDDAQVVAAALTQRPDLFRAAVGVDGRYDLLRPGREPAGEGDAPRSGGVEDRARFDALLADSPLRAVRDGIDYPAVLLQAGSRSGVDPAQSRKLAARLQQADPSGRAILLLTGTSSGQPVQSRLAEIVDQEADESGFFLNELLAAQ